MLDVLVAGGGPAGAVAALVLARGGARVMVVDGPPARTPKVGESLPGAAARMMRSLGLRTPGPGGPHRPLVGNASAWGSDDLRHADFIADPDGPGWRLDRARFDGDLLGDAGGAGAEVRPGRVVSARRSGAGWQVAFGDGAEARCAWIVDATGRACAVARRSGAVRRRGSAPVAVCGLFRPGDGDAPSRTFVEAAPEGWWYAAGLPDGRELAVLHAGPRDAARMVASPQAWLAALGRTRHVAAALDGALDGVRFEGRLFGAEACTAGLDRIHGEGWVACGDAAFAFDPISSQGILSAMHGGMGAATAVLAFLGGGGGGLAAYAARQAAIEAAYRRRLCATYAAEGRWPQEPFWASRRAAA